LLCAIVIGANKLVYTLLLGERGDDYIGDFVVEYAFKSDVSIKQEAVLNQS